MNFCCFIIIKKRRKEKSWENKSIPKDEENVNWKRKEEYVTTNPINGKKKH